MTTIVYRDEILQKINELRQKLIHTVNQKGKLTDEEVIQISQQLDVYILEFQKHYKNNKKKT
ncbi:aspartyl-phosphate phosphatase Spo0E family protein [Paenibacillus faecalis]|uniref:aspartyl-phosphate phosphatase Spo0E family protein n=1 Tax=Paenibacillus faecalis TaxID=2079532 RepID=UPI000D1057B5|nr:aspartyl-phosphate phosphatase Spo0E family protein [Paenibacillus faecalis]